ncbi:GGDEF domain-containing protein [Ectobacillus ponti]|uniref:GGDEF domain-containing protein n=1 Tax=Ectobacillus ponti TaxID=2961894 RepID=A0AA42BTZ7_9BACI|nr:GGDEF domain-containing protein [Ectobacillus ponti]MCP8970018.1 GGDEF domain-containing protein [Ectobacillus ponti]
MKYRGRALALLICICGYIGWTLHTYLEYGAIWTSGTNELIHIFGNLAEFVLAWWIGLQFDKVQYLSERDALTGVYNRRYLYNWFERLQTCRGRQEPFSLLLLDIDRFKLINDTHGHRTGDLVIAKVAHILKQTLRKTDMIVRWGGDEFLIIAKGEACPTQLRELIQQNLQGLSAQLDFPLSASIGVLPDASARQQDLDALVHAADCCMYEQKQLTRTSMQ